MNRLKIDPVLRQQIMAVFVIAAFIFLLFNWTYKIAQKAISNLDSSIAELGEQISKVEKLSLQARINSQSKKLTQSLASYAQQLPKVSNLKMLTGSSTQQQVEFRTEDLVYSELAALINSLESYDNVWIKSIRVSRRFNNDNRVDAVWNVVRLP